MLRTSDYIPPRETAGEAGQILDVHDPARLAAERQAALSHQADRQRLMCIELISLGHPAQCVFIFITAHYNRKVLTVDGPFMCVEVRPSCFGLAAWIRNSQVERRAGFRLMQ
ncbi:MAG: hypothetical protein WDN30_15460 [Pararobbsia sp.]